MFPRALPWAIFGRPVGARDRPTQERLRVSKDKRNGVDAVRWPGAIHSDVSGKKALNESLKIEKMRSVTTTHSLPVIV
jgi:hypothetical protein